MRCPLISQLQLRLQLHLTSSQQLRVEQHMMGFRQPRLQLRSRLHKLASQLHTTATACISNNWPQPCPVPKIALTKEVDRTLVSNLITQNGWSIVLIDIKRTSPKIDIILSSGSLQPCTLWLVPCASLLRSQQYKYGLRSHPITQLAPVRDTCINNCSPVAQWRYHIVRRHLL